MAVSPAAWNSPETPPSSIAEIQAALDTGTLHRYTACGIRREGGKLMFTGPFRLHSLSAEIQTMIMDCAIDKSIGPKARYNASIDRWEIAATDDEWCEKHAIGKVGLLSLDRSMHALATDRFLARVVYSASVGCYVTTAIPPGGYMAAIGCHCFIRGTSVESAFFQTHGRHLMLHAAVDALAAYAVLDHMKSLTLACRGLVSLHICITPTPGQIFTDNDKTSITVIFARMRQLYINEATAVGVTRSTSLSLSFA